MANELGKFALGFGEGFLKTLQDERERKRKEQEFNQEMSYKIRQMNLANAIDLQRMQQQQAQFQEKMKQDQTQFDIGMDYKNRSLLEDTRQFDESMGFKQSEADRDYQLGLKRIGLGYSELNQRKKEFDYKTSNPTRSEVDQRKVEELFGKSQGYLDEFKAGRDSWDDKGYSGWKNDATSTIGQLLEKVGVPVNGEVVNYIRSAIAQGDDLETKRKYLDKAIEDVYKQGYITDEQKRALKLWKELGTR